MMPDDETIRCMQLPLLNMQILVPNSAVAEIIGYDRAEALPTDDDWYEGRIPWRGVMVPVVSVESLCGSAQGEPGARTRIAVLYSPRGDENVPYLGVIMQDIPRAYLAEAARLSSIMPEGDCDYLSSRVDEFQENLMIPDLDAIVDALKQRDQG